MRTITKILYPAFAGVILVMATLTANCAPGDIFASINRYDPEVDRAGASARRVSEYRADARFGYTCSVPKGQNEHATFV